MTRYDIKVEDQLVYGKAYETLRELTFERARQHKSKAIPVNIVHSRFEGTQGLLFPVGVSLDKILTNMQDWGWLDFDKEKRVIRVSV